MPTYHLTFSSPRPNDPPPAAVTADTALAAVLSHVSAHPHTYDTYRVVRCAVDGREVAAVGIFARRPLWSALLADPKGPLPDPKGPLPDPKGA